jgi:hypothetical protein
MHAFSRFIIFSLNRLIAPPKTFLSLKRRLFSSFLLIFQCEGYAKDKMEYYLFYFR